MHNSSAKNMIGDKQRKSRLLVIIRESWLAFAKFYGNPKIENSKQNGVKLLKNFKRKNEKGKEDG